MRLILVLLLGVLLNGRQAGAEPAEHWRIAAPSAVTGQEAISRAVEAYGRQHQPSAVMVVQGDQQIAAWGDIARPINIRSARKSMLSALYGIAVAEGRIQLSSTLAQLGIDDKPPSLTVQEKQATVRDLLMARSGVYHPAAYETSQMQRRRPERGSHAPGTFWYYNNWDFNALGTIYRNATGEDIFQSFAQRIAQPLGMEDFSARDGRYVEESASIHPAYLFKMSARDLARFGLLYLNGGRWNGTQIVPAEWVSESTRSYSATNHAERGYGYLWWSWSDDEVWGKGAFMALGHGGQIIAVVPSRRLVAVETVDLSQKPGGVRVLDFRDLVRTIAAALHTP